MNKNITIRSIERVEEAVGLSEFPLTASAISKLEKMNYNTVKFALDYLEKNKKVKQLKTSNGIFWVV